MALFITQKKNSVIIFRKILFFLFPLIFASPQTYILYQHFVYLDLDIFCECHCTCSILTDRIQFLFNLNNNECFLSYYINTSNAHKTILQHS